MESPRHTKGSASPLDRSSSLERLGKRIWADEDLQEHVSHSRDEWGWRDA